MTPQISSFFQANPIDITTLHPLRRDGLLVRTLPFLLPAVLGIATQALSAADSAVRPGWLIAASVLVAVMIAAVHWLPWQRLPDNAAALPPLLYMLCVFLLREGAGGNLTTYAPLMFIPLFWLVLHGTRRQLIAAFVLIAALAVVSRLLSPHSPHVAHFQFLAALVTPVICFTAQTHVLQLRAQAHALAAVARIDVLTGLSNRRDWDVRLFAEVERSRRVQTPCCVAVFDFDHFKRLNDAKGHAAGDAVLRESAAAWRRQLRATDLLARYGGEEFALLLPNCDMPQAVLVVERLRAETSGGQTCSAGVAQWDGQETVDELMHRADEALYRAKAAGRNRVECAP